MKKCMIVDDSAVIRRLVRNILEPLAFDCTDAKNGEMALDACRQAMPELIMLDWNMPVMDGMQFLGHLRKTPGGEKPVVIFCTSECDMAHIRAALEAGATDYVMKPFDKDIVVGKLVQNGIIGEQGAQSN
ncbi:MAG TPA: response regulator [Patescibacteria group bacterium]|nr:response regulator [Patescibacteria group bacterium]